MSVSSCGCGCAASNDAPQFTTRTRAPFRHDFVGSFLRPDELKAARAAHAAGALDDAGLRAVEDRCITDLVAKQKAHGLRSITDGEFRRSYWHLDFMWGLHGLEHVEAAQGYQFHGEETRADTVVVSGPISGENHPFVEHFRFVKALESDGVIARQTIPAPVQTLAEIKFFRTPGSEEALRKVYPTDEALVADLAAAYRTVILDLYAAGCRNVQLDDCTWGMYLDQNFCKAAGITPEQFEAIAEQGLAVNNAAVADLPADLAVTTHVCRGNYHSTWASEGDYEPVAPYLLARENVDAFYLEFDTPRSGGFEPLRFLAPDKFVVLGLVTSKDPALESRELLRERIEQAAQYVPLDRLCLSPQCGFASTEEGNKLTEAEQWAKIDLVRDAAREVWGC